MEKIQNYINGDLVPPKSGNYINNISPATGEIYSLIPDSDAQDIDAAVISANDALKLGVDFQKKNDMTISCIWQM